MTPDDWYDEPVPEDDDPAHDPLDPHDRAWSPPDVRPLPRLDRPDADLWDDDEDDDRDDWRDIWDDEFNDSPGG